MEKLPSDHVLARDDEGDGKLDGDVEFEDVQYWRWKKRDWSARHFLG
jgi:hypothetical protein